MADCLHLDITDEGMCLVCGVNITSDEYINSLPEVPPGSLVGDLMGMIQLAQATAEQLAIARRIRWVGTLMIRVPEEALWKEILPASFTTAKQLGYRGDFERWSIICKEYLEKINENYGRKGGHAGIL